MGQIALKGICLFGITDISTGEPVLRPTTDLITSLRSHESREHEKQKG